MHGTWPTAAGFSAISQFQQDLQELCVSVEILSLKFRDIEDAGSYSRIAKKYSMP